MNARAYLRASSRRTRRQPPRKPSRGVRGRARPQHRRNVCRERKRREARPARAFPAAGRLQARRRAAGRASGPPVALDRLGLAQAARRVDARQVRVVALDLPTSWQLAAPSDEFTARMFAALNAMMLECSPRWPARTTRTAAGDRRKASQGEGRRRISRPAGGYRPQRRHRRYAALRMSGAQFKRRQAAAERRSPRSPSGPPRG